MNKQMKICYNIYCSGKFMVNVVKSILSEMKFSGLTASQIFYKIVFLKIWQNSQETT